MVRPDCGWLGKRILPAWQLCLAWRVEGERRCSHMRRDVVHSCLALCTNDTDWHLSGETAADKAMERARGRGKVEFVGRLSSSLLPSFYPLLYALYSDLFYLLSVSLVFCPSALARCCQNHSVGADVFCSGRRDARTLNRSGSRRAALLRKPRRGRRTYLLRVPTAAVTLAPLSYPKKYVA